MPTRNRGHPGEAAAVASTAACMASAARAARTGWSCCRAGALNRAISASPTNCTTVPPSCRIAVVASSKYRLSITTISSGVERSEKVVKPRRSANKAVTSTTAPPSAACSGSASSAVATSGDMY